MRNASQTFHQSNEISDLHFDRGRHRHYNGIVFENGALVESYTPNLPEQVDALNSWIEAEDLPGEAFSSAAGVLKKLLLWIIQSDADRPRKLSSIARRAIAAAFATCPDEIPWKSLQQCADEFHATKQSFGKYSKEILELAHGNFQRPSMRSVEHRKKRAEISKRQWDGRRMTPEEKRARSRVLKRAKRARQAKKKALSLG